MLDHLDFRLFGHQTPILDVIVQRENTTHPHTLTLAGCNLVAETLSPMTSSSNWANDRRMFSIKRPIGVVVLNC